MARWLVGVVVAVFMAGSAYAGGKAPAARQGKAGPVKRLRTGKVRRNSKRLLRKRPKNKLERESFRKTLRALQQQRSARKRRDRAIGTLRTRHPKKSEVANRLRKISRGERGSNYQLGIVVGRLNHRGRSYMVLLTERGRLRLARATGLDPGTRGTVEQIPPPGTGQAPILTEALQPEGRLAKNLAPAIDQAATQLARGDGHNLRWMKEYYGFEAPPSMGLP